LTTKFESFLHHLLDPWHLATHLTSLKFILKVIITLADCIIEELMIISANLNDSHCIKYFKWCAPFVSDTKDVQKVCIIVVISHSKPKVQKSVVQILI
jgi:hypothetical protein